MRVEITDTAEADLAAISDYIVQDNPERAEGFVRELLDVCMTLETMAHRWPFVLGYKSSGLRKASYRGYIVVYRIVRESACVLRVLHTSRDLPPIFESLDDRD